MKPARKQQSQYRWSLLLLIVLAAVTYHSLFKDVTPEVLLAAFGQADWRYLLGGLAAIGLFLACEAVGVRLLLYVFRQAVTLGSCLKYALLDFYFSAITPGSCGGQPAQLYYMSRDRLPVGASSLVLLLYNMAYHLAALSIALLLLTCQGQGLLALLGPLKYLLLFGIVSHVLLAAVFFAAAFSRRLLPQAVAAAIRLLGRLRLAKDPDALLTAAQRQLALYSQCADSVRRQPLVLLAVFGAVLLHLWLLYSVPFWVYKAFGLSGCSLWQLAALQAALTLAIEALPLPGGMGLAEHSNLLVFGGIFGPLALPAMLLCRSLSYYAPLLAGGCAAALAHAPLRKAAVPLCSPGAAIPLRKKA